MIQSSLYDGIVERIHDVYASCSFSEQQQLLQILREISITGDSQTLEQLWLTDFKEVPVSIDKFISDPEYMGGVTRNGDAIYPFWKNFFRDIFTHGNKYTEICLTGSTRVGKTSSSIVVAAYMLYRLMLYRNPHLYFMKKEVSRFTIAFANLTKELAMSVAYREFNDTLRDCPWFMERGKISASDRNFYYIPEGDKIEIIPASDSAMLLGKQLWCLKGDTQILTTDGIKILAECEDTYQEILQYTEAGIVPTFAEIRCTGHVKELIRIELEDGTVIEGTPDHKIMLSDGSYKCLGDLRNSDDLLTFNITTEVDEMNLLDKDVLFDVYMHTSPNNKRYIGITSQPMYARWGKGGRCYQDNAHFWSAIQKYGWDNFKHEVVASGLSLKQACDMEVDLIAQYDTMNSEHGYNHTTGGNWSTPDDQTRKKISEGIKRAFAENPEIAQRRADNQRGKHLSEEAKLAISQANKGRKMSEEFREKQRARRHSSETLAKLRGHKSWCKGLTKETDERLRRMSEHRKGRKMSSEAVAKLSQVQKARYANGFDPVWITDGNVERVIQRSDILPDSFRYGRLGKANTYVHKGSQSKKVTPDEAQQLLTDGWELGRPSDVGETIRKANQRMHWEYEGQRFETASDLANYLRSIGYPKIVGSTITALWLKGFNTSKIYSSLAGKVIRVDHEDKINSEN